MTTIPTEIQEQLDAMQGMVDALITKIDAMEVRLTYCKDWIENLKDLTPAKDTVSALETKVDEILTRLDANGI